MKARPPGRRESEPSSPLRSRLREATEAILAIRRKMGEEGVELRADVLADVKEALVGDEPSLELIEVAGVPGPQVCLTTEGVYRAVLASSASIARTPISRRSSGRWSAGTSTRLAGDAGAG